MAQRRETRRRQWGCRDLGLGMLGRRASQGKGRTLSTHWLTKSTDHPHRSASSAVKAWPLRTVLTASRRWLSSRGESGGTGMPFLDMPPLLNPPLGFPDRVTTHGVISGATGVVRPASARDRFWPPMAGFLGLNFPPSGLFKRHIFRNPLHFANFFFTGIGAISMFQLFPMFHFWLQASYSKPMPGALWTIGYGGAGAEAVS
mmetsp:Transcript_71832/g.164617  ORF Transcript_71832/g.164617 Transcript_71832/m.164617 type:complete len:202 (+) Transcript_71832:308-913(+)